MDNVALIVTDEIVRLQRVSAALARVNRANNVPALDRARDLIHAAVNVLETSTDRGVAAHG